MGADFVKVCAGVFGGPDYIRSLHESLPALHLVGAELPLDDYHPYLEAGAELLQFKNSLDIPALVEREKWEEISRRASSIVNACDSWTAEQNPQT
jgi:2-keto-3-deoxy-6-phosphogluconate aldolase